MTPSSAISGINTAAIVGGGIYIQKRFVALEAEIGKAKSGVDELEKSLHGYLPTLKKSVDTVAQGAGKSIEDMGRLIDKQKRRISSLEDEIDNANSLFDRLSELLVKKSVISSDELSLLTPRAPPSPQRSRRAPAREPPSRSQRRGRRDARSDSSESSESERTPSPKPRQSRGTRGTQSSRSSDQNNDVDDLVRSARKQRT